MAAKATKTTAAKSTDDKQYQELTNYLDALENPPRTFQRGQIVKGTVKQVTDAELIVDVGGRTEGVVTGKELRLDNKKVEKNVGDEVLVYVLKPENEKGQIELSIRRTGQARKWHDLQAALDGDEPIEVTVTEANTGGVLVEIFEGLRGFIPSSQLDNSRIFPAGGYQSKEEATKQLQNKLAELIGEKIEVKVMEINREKNKVILSEKYVTAAADIELRENTLSNLQVGNVLNGEVTGIAPFGLFVNASGLEGLVHLSEISWDKVSNPSDFYNVGDKVEVQVIGIDDGGKRIAYSIKRLQEDPWDEIIKKYKVGQVIKGEITKVVDYGAFVRIEDGLNGLIHISELSNQLVKDPSEVVQEGEVRDVMVISMSKEERHLGLSIKRLSGDAKPVKKSKREGEEAAPEMARLEEIIGSDADAQ
ncbi:30S ribosomal protein S1 [Candidatus Dojkabacteria bacterium]|uniref:30S ribosomal protein S1 n=1 Tax=Candidatus Dojkabacteria bacterium TaxID=2099670 RepID=A0A955I5D4_9BACT|nr:30S ribosomal protein S1 [Candidatus Dojkabacteria bacterium]